MNKLMTVLLLMAGFGDAQQVNKPRQTVTTDPNAVLAFISGEVTMMGSTFPNITFQRGILTQLRTHKITKLTLLTTKEQLPNMAPLRAAGAVIYYLPADGVRMSGSTIFAGRNTVIYQNDGMRWTVMQADRLAEQARASLSLYLTNAKRF